MSTYKKFQCSVTALNVDCAVYAVVRSYIILYDTRVLPRYHYLKLCIFSPNIWYSYYVWTNYVFNDPKRSHAVHFTRH